MPPNGEMQQARPAENGASLLISVLALHWTRRSGQERMNHGALGD